MLYRKGRLISRSLYVLIFAISTFSGAAFSQLNCDEILSDRRDLMYELEQEFWDTYYSGGYATFSEAYAAYTALNSLDQDDDGLTTDQEICFESEPTIKDTDDDGFHDGQEFFGYLNPNGDNPRDRLRLDLDGDGLPWIDEALNLTSDLNPDRDGDGLYDGYELVNNLDPTKDGGEANELTDNSSSQTYLESQQTELLPLDYDRDGIADFEDSCPFDPLNDIDGDGICAHSMCVICAETGNCPESCSSADNCPYLANRDQNDSNFDLVGDSCQCGDLNSDGEITVADADLILDSKISIIPAQDSLDLRQLQNCDVNGDGVCSSEDRTRLLAYISDPLQSPIKGMCADDSVTYKRTLNRLGFGLNNRSGYFSQIETMATQGIEGYLNTQLSPSTIDDTSYEQIASNHYGSTNFDYPVLNRSYQWLKSHYCQSPSDCTDYLDHQKRIPQALADLKFWQVTHSQRQLDALLDDFWFNHFNVNGIAGEAPWLLPQYLEVISDNKYGKFENFLIAVTKAPAMMDYLSLNGSTVGNPNENFAREVMELHSVGPDGTYGDEAINEVARILTGYRYVESPDANDFGIETIFEIGNHDGGEKTVVMDNPFSSPQTWTFGNQINQLNAHCYRSYPDGSSGLVVATPGENEIEVLMCLLARHPKTAELIGEKLIRRFLGDAAYEINPGPSNPILANFIDTWVSTNGDLAEAVRSVILSGQGNASIMGSYFERSLYISSDKVKRPLVFAANLARAWPKSATYASTYIRGNTLDDFNNSHWGVMGDLFRSGDKLYQIAPPTGFSENSDTWLGNISVLTRTAQPENIITTNGSHTSSWMPDYYIYKNIWDEDEWIAEIKHFHDYVFDNHVLVQTLAERLLPSNGLDPEIHQLIVDYMEDNGLSAPDEPELQKQLPLHSSNVNALSRKQEAAKLLFALPPFYYH